MSVIDALKRILKENLFTSESVSELESKLFFEGDRRQPYLVRFTVLLFLSTIIATFGLLQDSTATVIGAMIVAPLMTPILATTAALVMGRLSRVTESALIVLGGVVMVIGLSFLTGFVTVLVISVDANAQIASRTTPNLDDLIVALAAGAAGAFAYSRDDVADSLPGVAIAIALVPPLSVAGIALSQGAWAAAGGALLLFATNLLSILLAGGIVFFLLGLGDASVENRDLTAAAQRKAYRYIGLAVLIVAIPLGWTTFRVAHDSLLQTQVKRVTRTWLANGASDLRLEQVTVYGSEVDITLSGAAEPQDVDELGTSLKQGVPRLKTAVLNINLSRELPVPLSVDPAADS